jgi:hypothetical protein
MTESLMREINNNGKPDEENKHRNIKELKRRE